MSRKIVGTSSGDSKPRKSPEEYLSEVASSSEAQDELGRINLFDYLVESTLNMDTNRNSTFSSIHSPASTGSRRRAHQLRVKRYTESGDEVSNDIADVLPEAAPARSQSYQGSSLSSSTGRALQQGGNRSGRAKRYQAWEKESSPVESSGSEEAESNKGEQNEEYGMAWSSSTPMDINAEEDDVGQSYIFEDQESGEEHRRDHKDDVTYATPEFQDYRAMIDHVLSTESEEQNDESGDENDSGSSESDASEGRLAASTESKDENEDILLDPSRYRNLGETVSVRIESDSEIPEPEEEDVDAASWRARESIQKRRAAALAVAAAVSCQKREEKNDASDPNKDGARTRRVHLSTPLEHDTSSNGGSGIPNSPEEKEQIRLQRIHELEQRKRKLEALAKASSIRRASPSINQPESPEGQKKPSHQLERPRTVNIDVYTGEVIGEMPKISKLLREQGRLKEDQDDSSSDYSSTEYDLPVTKERRKRRFFLLIFILIVVIFGVSFGVSRKRENKMVAGALDSPTLIASPTQAPSDQSLIGIPTLETDSLPSNRPSLRPVATPTIPASISPTDGPTPLDSLRQPIPETLPPLENVDEELYDILAAEWPSLIEVVGEVSSPQVRALQWLSSDGGLTTYTDAQKKQRFALATFFYSTSGDTWMRNDLWLSGDDECTWFTSGSDLQCDENGLYTSLVLNLNNLNGTIPAELGLLSNTLVKIDLIRVGDGPSLSGTFPSQIGMLSRLSFLNIRGNQVEGSIPAEFGNLTELRRLILRQNSISGKLPSQVGLLTKLRYLEVEQNLIGGTLPSEIGKLTLLESLLLSGNRFTGDLPSHLGRLASVKTFSGDMNLFTSLPTEIGNLSLLNSLILVSNNLIGNIPSEIGRLSNLLRLELSDNRLSGTIPSTLGNLSLLRDNFDLSVNQLSGPIPSELGRLSILRQLLIYSNKLTGQLPASLSALERLNTLRLESNILSGTIPASVCAVFNNSYPVFVSDCLSDLECTCCSHCCTELGECECQFRDSNELQFRCTGFP